MKELGLDRLGVEILMVMLLIGEEKELYFFIIIRYNFVIKLLHTL